jgi:multidrug efflux pump subunit AcrA (membrane-fusion protein)
MDTRERKNVRAGRGRVWAVFLAAVSLTLLLASCDRFGGGEKSEGGEGAAAEQSRGGGPESGPGAGNEPETTVFAVSTTEAVKGQLKNYLEVNGDVVTETTVQTFPDTAGKLTGLYVELGDRVRKDQVIAEIDPSRPGMKFEASPVKAPISGTVTDLPAQAGSTVSQQTSVAQISDMSALQVKTDVAERFISQVQRGLRAIITTEAYPDRVYEGRVAELSPVVDPQARMMEVKIDFTRGSGGLKAGMFVNVRIVTEEKEGVVKLPVDCVVERFGEKYVYVVKPADSDPADSDPAATDSADAQGEGESGDDPPALTVEQRPVKTGIEIDQKVEILEGVEAGEEVVYRGQTLLEEGSRVKVVSTVDPLSSEDVLE